MESGNTSPWPSGFGTRPWLIQAHGTRRKTQTFVDMLDRSLHDVTIPEMQGKICLGCVRDGSWLLMLDEATHDCFLLSITNRPTKIPLPPLRLTSEYKGTCRVLGYSPHDFTVVIASNPESEQNFLLHCRPGDEKWTDLLVDNDDIEIDSDIVAYEGKLYASTVAGDGLVVIDVIDGKQVKMQLLYTEQEEELHGSYVSYLVASCGGIFTVRTDFFGNPCNGVVTRIVVYRLDFEDWVWRRAESIGSDRAFLVSGDYGHSCSATEAQLQGNCVYLVWSSCDCERIYKYCLDDKTISFNQILPEPTAPTCRAYWVVPTLIRATGFKEQTLLNTPVSNQDLYSSQEEQQANYSATWHDLPTELLELVASKLSLVDRLRFPAVCKSWSKVSYPIEEAKVWPWLMHLSKHDGTCKMFDPLRAKEYTLQVEAFKTCRDQHVFRSSKDGWVVASADLDNEDILIINPFTQDTVDLPILDRSYHFQGVTLSSAPTLPDCMAFGVCSSHNGKYVTVETWQSGEDAWSKLRLDLLEETFHVASNNPIYFRGEFYCLGGQGILAVFNQSNNTWRVLDKPEPIYAELNVFDDDHEGAKFCYLVELAGDLISVFMCNADEPPRVFKLDQMKMAWTEVEDIGGAALFLDRRASYCVVSPGAGNGNKIFFPRYSEDGKNASFYDMETKMYHPTFYGLKEPLNCVWVVPNLKLDEYAC
ncbi:unnamed protein product [Urochloa decumbens]|uniref:F-box domain-containing protein n=1 Tax=Urochloa decumbens TaxID=240449 RepID=A0ABC9BDL2_9POAL